MTISVVSVFQKKMKSLINIKIYYYCGLLNSYERYRARLCARGNRTRDLKTDYYSGVIDLEMIQIILLIAVIKLLGVIAADMESAYIQDIDGEMVYYISRQ